MRKLQDPRFKVANREAIIGIVLVVVNFAIWYGFAYGLGSKDPSEYTYIASFPAWFFYSCIAGTIFMIVLIWITIKLFFKNIPFDDGGEEQ